MNTLYKAIIALISIVGFVPLDAMAPSKHPRPVSGQASSSSSSGSSIQPNDFLTKEEQEAIDADIAFTLMQKESSQQVSGNASELATTLSDAAYARELQMKEYRELSRVTPLRTRRPIRHDFSITNDRSGRSHSSLGHAVQLPMLPEFKSVAVSHIHSKQLDHFSCGYNALFNAANFEHHCGFLNSAHNYSVFQNKVLGYLQMIGQDPSAASSNTTTEFLARNILNLQPFYHLYIKEADGVVGPLLTGVTSITYSMGTPQHEIQNLLRKAHDRRGQNDIDTITALLNEKNSQVIHFLCNIASSNGIRHALLISLFQNSSGRGLYIFDNLNEPLAWSSETTRFIEYLCFTFDVSPTRTFTGPHLPRIWSSLK